MTPAGLSTHKADIITVHRLIGLGLGSAVFIALAACGSTQPPTPAATAAPTASAPSQSAPASTPETSAGQQSEPTSGDNGSKPSKSEIVAGLAKFYTSSQNLAAAKAQKFATCMVDQMYDKAKVATLEAMRDGDPTKLDKSDAGLLAESAVACESALK